MLHPFARGVLIVVGVILAVVGIRLWVSPVQHSEAAPASAKCTDAKTCFVKVDDAPELLLSTLVVLGTLLVLVGVNGRAITKFTGPGDIGFETASATKAAEKTAEKVAEQVPVEKQAPAIAVATAKARSTAMEQASIKGRRLTDPELAEIAVDVASEVAPNYQ